MFDDYRTDKVPVLGNVPNVNGAPSSAAGDVMGIDVSVCRCST